MFLGQFASPLLLGPLTEATSITAGYLVLSAEAVVIVLVLLVARRANGPAASTPPS